MQPLARAAQKPKTILLAPGLFGYSKVGRQSYFNEIQQYFDPGCTFPTYTEAPLGTIEKRAGQLMDAMKDLKPPIHVVAHSMGGLDARCLISRLDKTPNLIGSLATISTPHQGTTLADIVTGERPWHPEDYVELPKALVSELEVIIKNPINPALPSLIKGELAPGTIVGALRDVGSYITNVLDTPAGAFNDLTAGHVRNVFNTTYPSVGSVPVLCYSGISSPSQKMCDFLFILWSILKSTDGDNDGIVPAASSQIWNPKFGKTVNITMNHLEETGYGALFDEPLKRPDLPAIAGLYQAINAWQNTLPG